MVIVAKTEDVPGSAEAGSAEECRGVTLEHEGGSGGEVERARERLRPDPESPESGSDSGQRQSGVGAE